MKEFRSIKDVLVSDKQNLILSKLKKESSVHQYWTFVLNKILSELPYQRAKEIKKSIVRISENSLSISKFSKNSQAETTLILRVNSSAAVTRVRLLAPLILRSIQQQGLKINGIKAKLSDYDSE